jgi:piezo-type mechanosensitive ion channel component 1/2
VEKKATKTSLFVRHELQHIEAHRAPCFVVLGAQCDQLYRWLSFCCYCFCFPFHDFKLYHSSSLSPLGLSFCVLPVIPLHYRRFFGVFLFYTPLKILSRSTTAAAVGLTVLFAAYLSFCCCRFAFFFLSPPSGRSFFLLQHHALCSIMAPRCGVLSGVYFFITLHLLLLLVLLGQHLAALSLFVSFFCTLSRPASKRPLQAQSSRSTDSAHTLPVVPALQGYHKGEPALSAFPLQARLDRREPLRDGDDLPTCEMAVAVRRGTSFDHPPSQMPPRSPAQLTGREVVVEAAVSAPSGGGSCGGADSSRRPAPAFIEADTTNTNPDTEPASSGGYESGFHGDATALPQPFALRRGWVWATAVVSLLSVCASVALLLIVLRCSSSSGDEAGCTAPPWAYRVFQRTLLYVFTGIRIEQDGVRMSNFFFTVMVLSVVGSLSIGQVLCAALLRCRKKTYSRVGHHVCQFPSWIRELPVQFLTFAPLSLLLICVAGVGQGTVFGCVYVLLCVMMLLNYSRCVLSWRRRCWLLYLSTILLLWTVQACLCLTWVHEALETYAVPSSRRRRILVVWGLLPQTGTTPIALRWRVVLAVGVWWAAVECFCLHTTTYAAFMSLSPVARTCQAPQSYRALYKHALAAKEAKQLIRALEQQRAAHRKVEELRLERERITTVTSEARRAGHAPPCGDGGNRMIRSSSSSSNSNSRAFHRTSHVSGRPRSPFGSCGNQRYLTRESNPTQRSTQLLRDRHRELSSAASRQARDGWSSAGASFVDSANSCFCVSENQRSPRAPPITHTATAVMKARHSPAWCNLSINPQNCAHRSDSLTDKELRPSSFPSATVAEATRGDTNVALSSLPKQSDAVFPSSNQFYNWVREPTKSPVRTESDSDAHENSERFIHLLNTSPFSSSSLPLGKHRAAQAAAVAAAPVRHPHNTPTVSSHHASRRHRGGTPRSSSPFHSVSSVMGIADGAPSFERDLSWLASEASCPPAVDTTAVMPLDADARGARPSSRNSRNVDQADRRSGTFSRACCLQTALTGVLKMVRVYLSVHTLALVDERTHGSAEMVRGAVTEDKQEEYVGFAHMPNTAAVADAPRPGTAASTATHECSMTQLLTQYVLQDWERTCAILFLIHFIVSSTAINLAPALASVVYAQLQRPWPPRWYVRVEALVLATSVLGKCLLRALVASEAIPNLSLTAARYLNAMLLAMRVSSNSASSSSSPTVVISASHWESWFDITMSVVALYAVVIQWALVYADQGMLDCGGEGDHDCPYSLSAQLPTLDQGNEVPDVAEPASRGCTEWLLRWNRHRRGAGADYFSVQLFFDFVSLALFCWAYYAIAPDDMAPSQDNLFYAVQHNRLPGIFVTTALGLVMVLFAERIIYVLHALIAKFALHVLLAVAYHGLYLAWSFVRGSSHNSAPVSLLMAAKLASLWCGALQLRHGYPLHRTHDPFTVKTDVVHWFGHMVLRAVPFLLELRVLLDWSFSATTLKVQHWMLLEDIHHNVYRRYVDMHDLHWTSRHQGRRFPYYVRVYQGMLSFAAILLMLFFPLFWYSTFGPQVHASAVTAWTSEVTFRGHSAMPFFVADATLSSTTFRTAATTAVGGNVPNPSDLLRFATVRDTWQFTRPSQCSSQLWSYTPAVLTQLIAELRSDGASQPRQQQQQQREQAKLVVRNRVTRSRATEATYATCSFEESYTLSTAATSAFVNVLESWHAADVDDTSARLSPAVVSLPSFYTPYVVSSGSSVMPMTGAGIAKVDCTLTLHRAGQYSGFTCLACTPTPPIAGNESLSTPTARMGSSSTSSSSSFQQGNLQLHNHMLIYVVASTDVATVQSSLSLIPNVGIIALYTSFILVVSTYIRNFFAGDAHRVVLLQLANPEPVAELLRFIYLARSSASNGQLEDLWLEQLLFLELLDLLRSPEKLLALGGRRADDYARGKYRHDLSAMTKRPFDLRH